MFALAYLHYLMFEGIVTKDVKCQIFFSTYSTIIICCYNFQSCNGRDDKGKFFALSLLQLLNRGSKEESVPNLRCTLRILISGFL